MMERQTLKKDRDIKRKSDYNLPSILLPETYNYNKKGGMAINSKKIRGVLPTK